MKYTVQNIFNVILTNYLKDENCVRIGEIYSSKDATHIVACVNACDGVSDDDLADIRHYGGVEKVFELWKEAADRLEQAEKVIDELEKAAEYIETNAEECLDWDDSIAMLVPIDAYHKLMEALASAKAFKEKM